MQLKKNRLLAQKTQAEVAKAINLTQATYANYELGKTDPDINTLIKLAKYFHTTVDNIVGNETTFLIDKSKFSDTQLRIIENIQNLSENACKQIEAYVFGFKTSEELKNK